MTLFSLSLALIIFLISLYAAIILWRGQKSMTSLKEVAPFIGDDPPLVSLIVPACNEENTIGPAIDSFLRQDYPRLEVIVINDRSVDGTGEVIARLQEKHSNLKIYEVKELPQGWLGKAHALQKGAEFAAGDYLVFTDADILLEESTISRAVSYFCSKKLDHLSLIFKNIAKGWLLNGLILDSGLGLFLLFRPWQVKFSNKKSFIGVGAFNMVRKSNYLAIGGHSSFRLHPLDDIMLGKKMKQSGYRQDCLLGFSHVSVRWYESIGGMIDGLMKNVYSVINFRLLFVPGMLLTIFLTGILPLWGAILTEGMTRFLFSMSVILRFFILYSGSRVLNLPVTTVAGGFIAPYFTLYIYVKAVFLTHKNKGIVWRGTHYPLSELKKNEPVFF